MSLASPGVEVTITDQSQYLPAPLNSIPLVVFATASNKANPNGTGVAQGTTAANANKLFRVVSQRDLVTLYGKPFFYTTTNGTPIQGYELNEYGLLAAYSALGIANQVFCLRADIDLASLVGQTGRPTGEPLDGTFWLDTTQSTWGIFEWNSTTSNFAAKTPIVITDSDLMSGGLPIASLGAIGDYAVDSIQTYAAPNTTQAKQFFYKNSTGAWVAFNSADWYKSWPTVQGTQSNPTLTPGNTFNITFAGVTATITVASAPNNIVSVVANSINNLGFGTLTASVVDGKLQIFSSRTQLATQVRNIQITAGTGTVLSDLGINAGTYNQPAIFWGTSAQQPLWSSSQTNPRPTGSVWVKVGAAGNGLNSVMSEYDSTISSFVPKTLSYSTSDFGAIASLDSTGGKAIPANTVYAQYAFYNEFFGGPVYYWKRLATGPTVVTGTNTDPDFSTGPYTFTVQVSLPGSSSISTSYTVTLADDSNGQDFVDAWNVAAIPFTTCSLTTSGAIQLVHTEGGVILIDDNLSTGVSSGLLAEAGFVNGSTTGVKLGTFKTATFTPPATAISPSTGTNLVPNVSTTAGVYFIDQTTFTNAGSGYAVGDQVRILGTSLGGATPANDLICEVTSVSSGAVTGLTYVSGVAVANYNTLLSNWVEFDFTANEGAPNTAPTNGTNWFFSVVDEVDIMVNTTGGWRGYRNVSYDNNGFPKPSGTNLTDPNGPIVSATEPTTQSDGTALEYGDLWVSTGDLENYPIIFRWQSVDGVNKWVLIDNTDQTSSSGILFADARWATNDTTNPANDPIPTIQSLLTSNYLDLDAPSNTLYPVGMMLFNTRRSGYNVKQYRVNYFNSDRFPDEALPTEQDAWVSVSGLQSNGAPYMGRKAQRAMVVQALRSAIDTNTAIRDEDNFFNLLATPNYPELQPNMIVLNADRGETAYIVGDTPMGLPDDATAIQAWATNAAGATTTGEDGCVTRNTYLGLFYPSGLAPDLDGNLVAVPSSHMMLRTFLRNDNIAYPWLAAAGTRRGIIENATNIGYLDRTTGEFQTIKTRIGIRDVLYTNFINPMVFFTGNGLLNYGNKTSFNSSSALDRTNVARLVAYIRRQLTLAARPFIFEPNDALTRQEISGVIESLMVDLVAKRGIYDYLVVCDESNNTPARIDRNELWVDVAIEPVKAVEFIYIPVRILNTGELSQ